MRSLTIVVIMAMFPEAQPLIDILHLKPAHHPLEEGLPMKVFHGKVHHSKIVLIVSGKDKKTKVDNVATQPATLAAFLAVKKFKPDLLINAGTAGGLKRKGANIGDVYLGSNHIQYHDRRISLPGFREYGIGFYSTPKTDFLAKQLGLKQGIISTGNSLDTSIDDLKMMEAYGGSVKDMEAAAIAWVAEQYATPLLVLKAVTDLVDSQRPTSKEFIKNLEAASANLNEKLVKMIQGYATDKFKL